MHHRKTDREFCIYVCGNIDFIRRYTQTFYADVYRCNREHRRLYAFSVKPSSRYKAPSRRSLGWEAAAHPDTTLAVAEAATSPCADLHAASGQCSCPHMRAAFKLLAVQTTRRRAWASGGVPTTAAAMHAISSGPNARTHAATHLPRRRRPSRHHSQRRAPVPPAPATAPTPAPSQRETPVRRNAAGLADAPHVSDLPAPSAAPSCAGGQAYQHARACACTPAAQRQGTPAQRTRAELSKTRPAHPRGECAPGRQYRRMAWPGGEAVV
jgi:hypothetical protein